MIIWWLSTQFVCFMTSGHFLWLPWQHSILKKEFFKWQLLQNRWSSMTLYLVQIWHLVWLPWQQKTPIVIMGKWLNCIFSITSEVIWTIFGICDHLMIVYPVYVFYDQRPFCLAAMATLNFKKEFFKWQLLQNNWSSMTLIWYKCCLGKGNSK